MSAAERAEQRRAELAKLLYDDDLRTPRRLNVCDFNGTASDLLEWFDAWEGCPSCDMLQPYMNLDVRLAALHARAEYVPGRPVCDECRRPWPCKTRILLDELEEAI